jgi:hypothetical protein
VSEYPGRLPATPSTPNNATRVRRVCRSMSKPPVDP